MRDTRSIIAEQAQRIIKGGSVTDDVEVTTDELEVYVDQAFGQLIRNNYFENKMEGEMTVNGSFIYSFIEDVLCDEDRDKYYVKIPSTYVNLPNDMGIFHVSSAKDEALNYKPVPNNFSSMTRGLLVGTLEGNKGYYIENTRLWLVNVEDQDKPEKLLVKLVGGIQDDDVDVDIPLDIQAQLVNMTVQLFITQQQAKKDIQSDNIR